MTVDGMNRRHGFSGSENYHVSSKKVDGVRVHGLTKFLLIVDQLILTSLNPMTPSISLSSINPVSITMREIKWPR